MTVAIKKQLDESLRDALLALYLNKVVPADDTTKNLTLKTAQDLYEYWLLDVLVSQDVPTTPVACAIASLQQYINRILLNMEPGYDSATMTDKHVQTWRNEMHQYPSWAAHQNLLYFPAIYLEPGLRNNKSDNFQQLENDLNQNRIQSDEVQTAVLAYLTRFEEVANLNILNGYIDGEDFANSTYYFIAKSRSENTYFWRSLNMAKRPFSGQPTSDKSPKEDQPDPYAWSDWEKADVPIPDDAIEHSIRPVWFNNRLFVIWAECIYQEVNTVAHTDKTSPQGQKTNLYPHLRLSLCYKKSDNSWSAPRVCLDEFCKEEIVQGKETKEIKRLIGTVAVHYQEDSQSSLFMALALNITAPNTQLSYTPLKTARLDRHLALTFVDPSSEHKQTNKICRSHKLFESKDEGGPTYNLQSKFHIHRQFKSTLSPIDKTIKTGNGNHKSFEQFKISFSAIYNRRESAVNIYLEPETDNTHPSDFDKNSWIVDYKILTYSSTPQLGIGSGFGDLIPMLSQAPIPGSAYGKQISINSTTLIDNPIIIYSGIHLSPIYKDPNALNPYRYTFYVMEAMKIEFIPSDNHYPRITTYNSTQFIDFSNSKISNDDNDKQPRAPIRLNTVFTAEMIRRTEDSLDELFSWETQHLPEPSIPGDGNAKMDFHGPYGRYFTELFLYLPWLIAHRLNAEHQYDEAERWIQYVFNPGRKQDSNHPYWCAVPLTGPDVPSFSLQAPHDPHQIALSHPVHFRKALYFLYLDILINRGDAAYRELTPDSLSEAKLWYVRTLDLLGPRPEVQRVDQWSAISLQKVSETTSKSLRTFEKTMDSSSLLIREGDPQASLPEIDTPYLHLPFNPALLKRWDIAEGRLYNLRHNLDIAGKPLHLPLFATPLDPRALLGTHSRSDSSNSASGLSSAQIPPYRFTVMHSQAMSAVENVCQFGATLLSLIERKEQAHLQELQQQQVWELAKMSVDLQTQALRIDHQNRQALLASKAIAQGRVNHYRQWLEKDVSEAEAQATQLYLSSGSAELKASTAQVAAGGMMMIPSIFGFSNGGSRWEGAMHSATALAQCSAVSDRTAAANIDRAAQFARRREEWTLSRDQAQLELAQIEAQLAHFTEQETATRLQVRQAETALSQTRATYDFLSKRFTKAQLYQWLNSQFSTLYYQAYDAVLALCLAAEACWRYERADFTTRFIHPGAWNTTYRGLGAGEQLKLSLLKMQCDYLQRNERELEIRKTVSLRNIKDKDSSVNKTWTQIQADLKSGVCVFELTHAMFENDYQNQNHYLRRLKTISVSLPALLGPYENVRATLTQTSSKVFMLPGDETSIMESKRANQQIALSTGVDDNGLFTLNFNDDRYLPFEYTGAISAWRLTFPNPAAQKILLDSLTDIIVHVSYTARVGGVK